MGPEEAIRLEQAGSVEPWFIGCPGVFSLVAPNLVKKCRKENASKVKFFSQEKEPEDSSTKETAGGRKDAGRRKLTVKPCRK